MLYRDYKEKLAKRRRTFDRLWRLRLLFLFLFLLLLAAIGAMLGVRGIVYGENIPESISYGEHLSATASTVFGKAGFEYRAAGETRWTREEPRAAGEYECRAVGTSIVGTGRPGAAHSYRILPVRTEVRVASGSLVYGEEPTFSAALKYDDELHVGSYTARALTGATYITADVGSVTVVNGRGEDVTASYEFDAVGRNVTDVARSLVLKTASETFTYDGTEHRSEETEVGGYGLAAGHVLQAEYPAAVAVGKYTNTARNVHILDENGEDVTGHYRISYETGTIEVLPRKIAVETQSDSFVYDGTPHRFEGFRLAEGELAEGEEIVLSDLLTATNANIYFNCPAISVRSGGSDVTRNYEIEARWGTVEILRRKIAVETQSDELTYDGTTHNFGEFRITEGEPAEGEEVVLSDILTARNAAEYTNAPRIFVRADGIDVSQNYEIVSVYGSVAILPRVLRIRTASDAFVYDGAVHSYEIGEQELTEGSLAENDAFSLSGAYRFTDAGRHENHPEISVLSRTGNETGNYEMHIEYGFIEIARRVIGVKTEGAEFVYDGAAHTFNEYTLLPADGEELNDLAPGHRLTSAAETALTVCGSGDNVLRFTVRAGASDVTENYEVRVLGYGVLKVTPLAITLRADSGTFTYDGTPHSVETWSQEEHSLVAGHRVEATYSSFVDAETYENAPAEPRIVDGAGNDMTENYEVTWLNGSIVIEKRQVALLTDSDTVTYDGQPHSAPRAAEAPGSLFRLATGHRLDAVFLQWTNAGRYENTVDPLQAKVRDENGADVTKNYEIKWSSGWVVISKRPLKIRSRSGSWMYDAQPHAEEGYDCEGLAEGQTFSASVEAPTITARGSRANDLVLSDLFVSDGSGENRFSNYDLDADAGKGGTIEITPRPITVRTLTDSDPWIYDGVARAYEKYEVGYEKAEKLAGHEVKVTFLVRGEMANVGEYENACEARILADGTDDVTENYEIEYIFGTVKVEKRPLLVETGTQSFVYDDTPHDWQSYTFAEDQPYRLVDGHTIAVIGSTSLTACGSEENKLEFHVQDADHADVTRNYDIQTVAFGTVTVTQRPVTLRSGSAGVEYDALPHSAPDYSQPEGQTYLLVAGHSVVADYPEFTAADSYFNEPQNTRVMKGGQDVTENYKITWEYGTVEIFKRAVTLATDSGEFVYDAELHTVPTYTPVENTLVGWHDLSAEYPGRTDVGSTQNVFVSVRILDRESGEDVSANYTLTWAEPGKIAVVPRPVTITTGSGSHVYDDTEFSVQNYTVEPFNEEGQSGILVGHNFMASITFYTGLTDVGSEENRLILGGVKVMAGDTDVTGNYIFEGYYVYGTLEVTKRPVTITTGSGTHVYDAQLFGVEEYEVEAFNGEGHSGLVEGHLFEAEIVSASHIEVVSKFVNIMELEITVTAGERTVTDNYEFSYEWGRLEVTKRPIELVSGDGGWTYFGKERTCENFEVDHASDYAADPENKERGLVEGHVVKPAFRAYTEAGTHINEMIESETTIVNGKGEDVTVNYNIRFVNSGTVEIARRPVSVSLKEGVWVYDGAEHMSEATAEEEGDDRGILTSLGHTLISVDAKHVREITDSDDEVRYEENDVYGFVIHDGEGGDVSKNYELVKGEMGRLRIKTPIYIRVYDVSKPFDGTPLTYEAGDWRLEKKPPDLEAEWISVTLGGSVTEIGFLSLWEVKADSVCRVFDGMDDLTSQNRFEFTGDDAPLRVTARIIEVRSISIARERGEEPLKGTDTDQEPYWVSFGSLLDGHTLVCDVTGELSPEEEVAENKLDNIRILDGDGNDVTKYYEIRNLVFGTLSWVDEGEGTE